MALEDTASAAEADKAINFIAETDHDYAKLYSQVEGIKDWIKIAKADAFLTSTLSTVKEREMESEACAEVRRLTKKKIELIDELEKLKAIRRSKEHILDLYRTGEASRRRT